jgi:hypothetical protein
MVRIWHPSDAPIRIERVGSLGLLERACNGAATDAIDTKVPSVVLDPNGSEGST